MKFAGIGRVWLMPRIIFAILVLATVALAQEKFNNFAAAGLSWNRHGSPALAGTAAYARLVSEYSRTYSFTLIDALPATVPPYAVTTQTTTGVLQKLFSINGWKVMVPAAAGVSWTGQNVGWAWTTGAVMSVPVGKFMILPNFRVLKSSINGGSGLGGSGYQLILGTMFGGGWN